jgi:hypothetical protein
MCGLWSKGIKRFHNKLIIHICFKNYTFGLLKISNYLLNGETYIDDVCNIILI